MKKLLSFLLLLVFIFSLTSASDSAVKKKKAKRTRRHYRRIIRNWPKGGPRPVFPTDQGEKAPVVAQAPAPAIAPDPVPAPPKILPVAAVAQPVKTSFLVEGGLAGGAAALELGYSRAVNDKISLSGALGYAVGSGYGVVLLDPVRATYDFGAAFVGAGLNYAIYSSLVTNIPGLAGTISNKNMFGVELFAAKQFGRYTGRVGYSTALGLRVAAGYPF